MSSTIGETLSSARRAQGVTLTEAEVATCIRAKRLEALEKDDWDALPNPAYVKGYIISYAKFLGLDPNPLLEQFRKDFGFAQPPSEQLVPREQVVAPRDQAHAIPFRAVAAVIAVIAVGVLVVWGIGRLVSGPEEPLPIPNTPAESTSTTGPAGEGATPGVGETQTPAGQETTAPATLGEPFTLRVEVAPTAASWLRVTIDGLKAYEGTLPGGETKEWEVTDTAVIRIGKASAVTVYRDGEVVEIPPGAADVPEITLTTQD